jgi:hypothetical protein
MKGWDISILFNPERKNNFNANNSFLKIRNQEWQCSGSGKHGEIKK